MMRALRGRTLHTLPRAAQCKHHGPHMRRIYNVRVVRCILVCAEQNVLRDATTHTHTQTDQELRDDRGPARDYREQVLAREVLPREQVHRHGSDAPSPAPCPADPLPSLALSPDPLHRHLGNAEPRTLCPRTDSRRALFQGESVYSSSQPDAYGRWRRGPCCAWPRPRRSWHRPSPTPLSSGAAAAWSRARRRRSVRPAVLRPALLAGATAFAQQCLVARTAAGPHARRAPAAPVSSLRAAGVTRPGAWRL